MYYVHVYLQEPINYALRIYVILKTKLIQYIVIEQYEQKNKPYLNKRYNEKVHIVIEGVQE